MKQEIHSAEWLAEARRRAGLSQAGLAKLAGIAIQTVCSLERGARNASLGMWAKIDGALRPLVPIMYVDVDELILDARAYQRRRGEDAPCRLYYEVGSCGMAFTDVCPVEVGPEDGSCVTVPWAAAVKLLEAQKALLD